MSKLTVTWALSALVLTGLASARPIPINDSARIIAPAPFNALNAAIDGDSILVTARDYDGRRDTLLHYRRSGASWQLADTLLNVPMNDNTPSVYGLVAARGGVAATLLDGRLIVFERSGATWVQRPVTLPAEKLETSTLSVDGGRVQIGTGDCNLSASILAKNAAGTYVQTGHLTGDPISCGGTAHAGGYLSGDFAINSNGSQTKTIYRRDAGSVEWARDFTIPYRARHNGDFDISLPFVVSGGYGDQYVYRRDANGWTLLPPVSPLDRDESETTRSLLRDGNLITLTYRGWPEIPSSSVGTSFYVHRPKGDGPNGADSFEHVAILQSVGRPATLYRPEASGRTIVSQGWISDDDPSTIFVFELPAVFGTAEPIHDDFQGGTSAQWAPLPGSQLSIVTSGHSRVYRQQSVAGDAGALVDGSDWPDQAVQANFRPWQFSGSDRWFGLVARWQDSQNFYYVSLRNSNRVSLRKVVNGVTTEIASAPLSVTLRRHYLVRLEARGKELIATIDGGQSLHAFDASLTHGAAGFAGYRAAYDVDNFSVSPLATPLLHVNAGDYNFASANWTLRGNDWQRSGGPEIFYFSQPDTAIEGHAVIGVPTDDEIVSTLARIDAFNPTSTAGWVGVMNRYVDNRNYYSLVLRSNGNVQLRRTVNGTMTVIAGRAFTVTPGRFYALRLDAVGNRLRGHVDGVLQLEVMDATFPRGRTGLATSKAAASFSGYDAWQP